MSQISLYDGTTTVNIDQNATLELEQNFVSMGGSSILRFLGGGAEKQQNWQKWKIEISGKGWVPSGLFDLDYSQELTLTVVYPGEEDDEKEYTVLANRPTENWNINAAQASWTLVCEEV